MNPEPITELRERYRLFNERQPAGCLVQFGRGVGFCAEYLGLIKRMVWCLNHQHSVCLGTGRPEGIGIREGWTDYFKPVFKEVDVPWLSAVNRPVIPLSGRLPFMGEAARVVLRTLTPCRRFMFDDYDAPERVVVDELGLDLDYEEALRLVDELIWCPNEEVEAFIRAWVAGLSLPDRYLGVHIRRGDKITEGAYIEVAQYVRAIGSLPEAPTCVYLATDDHEVREELGKALGARFQIVCSSQSTDTGHDQKTFNRQTPAVRYHATLRLMAELAVLRQASWFVGASPSNVFYLLRRQRACRNVIDASGL